MNETNTPRPPLFRQLLDAVKRHPGWTVSVILAGLGLGIFVLIWFQPQKLLLNQEVSEPQPSAASPQTGVDASPDIGPQILSSGDFMGIDHRGEGQALVVETADGRRTLRFEAFETSNGPDLLVYLSPEEFDADPGRFEVDFLDLGKLKGNKGDQNYELPPGVDLSKYRSVVVWCRRFRVAFASAPLLSE